MWWDGVCLPCFNDSKTNLFIYVVGTTNEQLFTLSTNQINWCNNKPIGETICSQILLSNIEQRRGQEQKNQHPTTSCQTFVQDNDGLDDAM